MTLPPPLQTGIDELVGVVDRRRLESAARRLSDAYRADGPESTRAAANAEDVAAYLAVRAPATYAAAAEVFRQVRLVRPDWAPTSVLDLGAGPAVASWAALETWPGVATVALVEVEPEMVRAGKTLAARGGEALRAATWTQGGAEAAGQPAGLVIASYLIGELDPESRAGVLAEAWARAADTLVIIEPGTTAGYHRVLEARAAVIEAGGSTLAPCPHNSRCPLPEGDWCHFATRLARTRTHRLAKNAERGFEDEKFSYVALSREPHPAGQARVIRRPALRPGHVVLDLCTPAGLEQRTVSRRNGNDYRSARKLQWGDSVQPG